MSETPTPSPASRIKEDATLVELLEKYPLHETKQVSSLYAEAHRGALSWPNEIRVHCDKCEGIRRHTKNGTTYSVSADVHYHFGHYFCTDCQQHFKTYGLRSERKFDGRPPGKCTKIYQEPSFGDPIPKNFYKLIGESNRGIFLQARRSVARGLGIGAYAYYRRIIETNKIELVNAILDVAEKTGADKEQIALLERAAEERQFSRAVDMLKEIQAIPPVLLINGQNPLSLLHDLLSEGLHAHSDEECLDRAKEAEIVLFEIARLIQIAVAERREVSDALNRIAQRKQLKKPEA